MVAHSYGGVCTAALLAARGEAVTSRLRAVALTDSVHGRSVERMPAPQREWFARQCRNWVTSETPLDTLVRPAVHQPPEEDEQAEDNEHDDAHRFDPPSSSDDDVDAKDGADARPHAASALKRCVADAADAALADACMRSACACGSSGLTAAVMFAATRYTGARRAVFGRRPGATPRACPRVSPCTRKPARRAAPARAAFCWSSYAPPAGRHQRAASNLARQAPRPAPPPRSDLFAYCAHRDNSPC